MAPQASSARARLTFHKEGSWAETPAGTGMQAIGYTSSTLGLSKRTAEDETISDDRNPLRGPVVGLGAQGNVNFNARYSLTELAAFLEGALFSTMATLNFGPAQLDIVAAARTVTRASGSWITDGVLDGQWIRLSGFTNAGNNQIAKVASRTALVITLDAATTGLVNETGSGDERARGTIIRNAAVANSYLFQREYLDLTQTIEYFPGCYFDSLSLSFSPEQILTGSFALVGKDATPVAAAVGGSVTARSTAAAVTASSQGGQVLISGAAPAGTILGMTLEVNNNTRALPQLFSAFPIGINPGGFRLGGNIDMYLESRTLLEDVRNHTEKSLFWKITDDFSGGATGNTILCTVPAFDFVEGSVNVEGRDSECRLGAQWRAHNGGLGYTVQFDLIPS